MGHDKQYTVKNPLLIGGNSGNLGSIWLGEFSNNKTYTTRTYANNYSQDGFSEVSANINIPNNVLNTGSGSFYGNHYTIYANNNGYDAYREFYVSISRPNGQYKTINERITENGTYTFSADDENGMYNITLNVSVPDDVDDISVDLSTGTRWYKNKVFYVGYDGSEWDIPTDESIDTLTKWACNGGRVGVNTLTIPSNIKVMEQDAIHEVNYVDNLVLDCSVSNKMNQSISSYNTKIRIGEHYNQSPNFEFTNLFPDYVIDDISDITVDSRNTRYEDRGQHTLIDISANKLLRASDKTDINDILSNISAVGRMAVSNINYGYSVDIVIPDDVEIGYKAFYYTHCHDITIPASTYDNNPDAFFQLWASTNGSNDIASFYYGGDIYAWLSHAKDYWGPQQQRKLYLNNVQFEGDIPNDVSVIPNSAFCNIRGITDINISNPINSIGNSAFYYCYDLSSAYITLNQNANIGSNLFNACSKLKTVTIIGDISVVPYSIFYECSRLENLNIPNTYNTIGSQAFYNCRSLTDITIPNTVSKIYDNAFEYCYGLSEITLPSDLNTLGSGAFEYCKHLKNVIIPDGVTTIRGSTFYGCSELLSATLSPYTTYIDYSAFNNCRNLQSIILPNDISYIGSNAFAYCYNLSSVIFPENLKHIDYEAFYCCSSLTSIDIPYTVSYLANGDIFGNCINLSRVHLTDNISNLSSNTFYNCSSDLTIDYDGTVDDWQNLTNNSPPSSYYIYEVVCSDGTIARDGTVTYDDDPGDEPEDEPEGDWYVSVNTPFGSITNGEGYYYDGDECTVSIEPDEHYGLADVSATINGDPLTLNIDGDRYYATFIVNEDVDIVFSASTK